LPLVSLGAQSVRSLLFSLMTTTKSAEHVRSQHYITQQMDSSDEFSNVNFDEDEDNEHYTDHNVSDDSIENSDSFVIGGSFVVRKDFVSKNVRGTIVMRQFVCNRQ
ncbi:hypothetical protein L195_g021260, partial [Trifolium pratense]